MNKNELNKFIDKLVNESINDVITNNQNGASVNEHIVNIISNKDKIKYIDIVWEMLINSYKYIGGFKSFLSKQSMIDNSYIWKLLRVDEKFYAVIIYKYNKNYGRKCVAMGTVSGKRRQLINLVKEILRFSFMEVSGKAEKFLFNDCGAKNYVIKPEIIQKVMPNKNIEIIDDTYYIRQLKDGSVVKKVAVGTMFKK